MIDRFRDDLEAVWPGWRSRATILGLAVSGGPDSLALLALAHAALPDRVAVATVDHALRPESADEARDVAGLCGNLGVPVDILRIEVRPGNVQANARTARYDALARWAQRGIAALATAHHADDQAETVVMRLNRGSGLAGLSGVRSRSSLMGETRLLRPLLAWRKQELVDVVHSLGWRPAIDPGNLDEKYDRARVRARMADCDWLDVGGIGQSAAHLAEAEDAIVQIAGIEFMQNVTTQRALTVYRPTGVRFIRKRVVQMIFSERGKPISLARASDLVEKLERGESGNVAGILAKPLGGEWRFEPEPERRTG